VLMILCATYNQAQFAGDSTYTQAQCDKTVITPQKLVQGCTVMRNVVTSYPHTHTPIYRPDRKSSSKTLTLTINAVLNWHFLQDIREKLSKYLSVL
jgi:hypothetical protein